MKKKGAPACWRAIVVLRSKAGGAGYVLEGCGWLGRLLVGLLSIILLILLQPMDGELAGWEEEKQRECGFGSRGRPQLPHQQHHPDQRMVVCCDRQKDLGKERAYPL